MDEPEEAQGRGRYRGRNAYFAKRIPSKPTAHVDGACAINQDPSRSCLCFTFNRAVLLQLSDTGQQQQLDRLLVDLPSSFTSEKHLQEALQPLVLKEAMSQAHAGIRKGNVHGILCTVAAAGDTTLSCTLDPFSEGGKEARLWMKPSTLFMLHVQRRKGMKPFYAMLKSENGSGSVVFDVLADKQLSGLNGAAIKAFPIAVLVSIQRMYKACQKVTSPIFLAQLLGRNRTGEEESDEEDDSEEEDSEEDGEWSGFRYGNASSSKRPAGKVDDRDSASESGESSDSDEDEGSSARALASKKVPLNASQQMAIDRFINDASGGFNRIQLWQGPPGTGKTRTIVQLLLRLMRPANPANRARVLVCAPSNHAVQVVMESFINAVIKDTDVVRAVPAAIVGVEEKIPDHLLQFYPPKLLQYWIEQTKQALIALEQQDLEKISQFVDRLSVEVESKMKGEAALATTLAGLKKYLPVIMKRPKARQKKRSVTQKTIVTCLNGLLGSLQKLRKEQQLRVEEECLAAVQFVFCTLNVSSRACGNGNNTRGFDILVVDEAGQSMEAETLIALKNNPSQVLLVGDPQQLSATVTCSTAAKKGLGRSLMHRLMVELKQPFVLLDTQYRMRKEIALFPNRHFYESQLRNAALVESKEWCPQWLFSKRWLKPCVFIDVNHGSERRFEAPGATSLCNGAEAALVPKLLEEMAKKGIDVAKKVIVITFYSAQARTIKDAIATSSSSRKRGEPGSSIESVRVCTVDSIQGSEAEVVILSFVRSNQRNSVGFLSDYRRLNVALTRAKFALVMIGNLDTLYNCESRDLRCLALDVEQRRLVVRAQDYFPQ